MASCILNWSLVALVCAAMAGCGEDSNGERAAGATCSAGDTCAEGRSCVFGRCRSACATDGECEAGLCLLSQAAAGTCGLPGEKACGTGGCVEGLTCGGDETCRVPCGAASDCSAGHLCVSGACYASMPEFVPGWVFYIGIETGASEIWAVRDDGSRKVQLTKGMTEAGAVESPLLRRPTINRQGDLLVFESDKEPTSGQHDNLGRLWRVAPDGTGLTHVLKETVVAESNSAQGFAGFTWYADGRHILYARHIPCKHEVVRVDVMKPEASQVLWAAPVNEDKPLHDQGLQLNPTNDDDVVHYTQRCGEAGRARRTNAKTGEAHDVTGIPAPIAPGGFSPDGSFFVFRDGNKISRVLASGDAQAELLYSDADATLSFGLPVVGNAGTAVYATETRPTEPPVVTVVAVDLGTMQKRDLGAKVAVGAPFLSWGRVPFEIDRDGDGLANGIDPDPDPK